MVDDENEQTLRSHFSTTAPLVLQLSREAFTETMEQTYENSQTDGVKVYTVSAESEQKNIEKTLNDVEIIEQKPGPLMEKQEEEEVNAEEEDETEKVEEDLGDAVAPADESEAGEAKEPETMDGEPEVKPEAEEAGEVEAEPEAKPEMEVEIEAETEQETGPEPEKEAEAEPEVKPEAEEAGEVEAEPEAKPEMEVEVEAETEQEAGPEPEKEAEAEPATETEVDQKPPEEESNIDDSNSKEPETNLNTNEIEEAAKHEDTKQTKPTETEEELQNDAPASDIEVNQEKPPLVEADNKIKPESCLTCNSKEDSNCGKEATEQTICKKSTENNNKDEHSGCYSMFDEKSNITMRGCVTDLTEEGFKYCLKREQFCALCYTNICNNKNISSDAADVRKFNIIVVVFTQQKYYSH
uniref:DUF753 domain-containing protein n=1 Tax=Glossina brevipalpis TaxID=37001 RepID=A0A1A9WZI4_9MUSC